MRPSPARLRILIFALAPVAIAGGLRADDRGLVVEAEWWSAAAVGADLGYAFVAPESVSSGTLSGGGVVRTIGPGREGVAGFRIGKRFGLSAAPAFEIAFWESDVEGNSSTGTLAARVGATLAAPDFAIGRSLVDSAEAFRRIRTTVLETVVRWQFAPAERTRIALTSGIRWFRAQHETVTTYRVDGFGGPEQEIVNQAGEASGLGPLVAASFDYLFAKRWRVGGRLGLAAPVGEIEGETSDIRLGDRLTLVQRPGERDAFIQPSVEIRVGCSIARGVSLYGAWRWQELGEVAVESRFVDDVGQNAVVSERTRVGYEGAAIGVRWEF